jgi:hypothetical protein
MPIHERCHCGVLPIVGGKDPGRNLNEDEFKHIYGEAGSTAREDLAKVRVEVHEHGELGPVLRKKGDNFRGPSDVKPRAAVKSPALTPAQKVAQDREALARTRAAQVAKERADLQRAIAARKSSVVDRSPEAIRARAVAQVKARQAAPLSRSTDKAREVSRAAKQKAALAARPESRSIFAPRASTQRIPPTPKINALPRKPRTTGQATTGEVLSDTRSTNPNYGKPGYNVNCVHVVATYEMRRRGFNVKATALPQSMRAAHGRDAGEALSRWRTPEGRPAAFTARNLPASRIEGAILNGLPPGGRGWVRIGWKDGGGHIMNVERMADGSVRWLEAQTGKAVQATRYTKHGVSFHFVRVDNLVPTDGIAEFMEAGL